MITVKVKFIICGNFPHRRKNHLRSGGQQSDPALSQQFNQHVRSAGVEDERCSTVQLESEAQKIIRES